MRSYRIVFLAVSLLVAGCAESSFGDASSGGGGEDQGDGGSGGGAGGQGEAGGGSGGGEEISTAPGAVRVAVLDEPASQLVCQGGRIIWAEQKSRRVRSLGDDAVDGIQTIATMAGDGQIVLRSDYEMVVGVLGESGSVHRFDGGEMVVLAEGSPVLNVAAGEGGVIWYDGRAILDAQGELFVPAGGVRALAAYAEGPLWISGDGRVYKFVRNVQIPFGVAGEDFYPDTFFAFGATAAWGSRSGFKVLTMTGKGPFSTGHDVADVSSGVSGITYCDARSGGVDIRVLHPEAYSNVDKVAATHPTCTSVVECGGAIYWATARGTIFKVPVPSLGQE